ncbi:hypothetical protein [Roseivivax marinus]|uniref:hypothetical protein n=1 Tax=Roseivivax marinus TaxID=1379903 RepID=UPI00273E4570|nr:hypothetical protein [Roseivivax marinus]
MSNPQEYYAQKKGADDSAEQARQISDNFARSGGLHPIFWAPFVLIGFIAGFAVLVGQVGSSISVSSGSSVARPMSIPEWERLMFPQVCRSSRDVGLSVDDRYTKGSVGYIRTYMDFGVVAGQAELPRDLAMRAPVRVAVKTRFWGLLPTDHRYAGWTLFPERSYVVGYLERSDIAACAAVPEFREATAFVPESRMPQRRTTR